MKKPKEDKLLFKADKNTSKTVKSLKEKPVLVAKERNPEEFEEEISMDIRMKPQPLRIVKGKSDKK